MKADRRPTPDDPSETRGEYPGIDLEVLARILMRRASENREARTGRPLTAA